MRKEDCFYLGKIVRKHSFKGQVVAKLDTDEPELYTNLESVFVALGNNLVPFFIEEFSDRNNNTIILKLENIKTETDGKNLVEKIIFTPKKFISQNAAKSIQLKDTFIGYNVIDVNAGQLGILSDIIENPYNPLLLITKGTNEIYLPLQENFILDINENEQTITVQCPEGLISLYN